MATLSCMDHALAGMAKEEDSPLFAQRNDVLFGSPTSRHPFLDLGKLSALIEPPALINYITHHCHS